MTSKFYIEGVESAFRTITDARLELRRPIFERQAADAFEFGRLAGIDKIEIVDRLDALGAEFGWSPEERQALIAAAINRKPDGQASASSDLETCSASGTDLDKGSPCDDVPRPPEYSDEAIALLFAKAQDNLRYVAKLGRWFVWNGAVWREDDTLRAKDLVRGICRDVAAQCAEKEVRIAKSVASAKTVAGVESLAKADRLLAATVDQFDRDPFLLNTPAGVFDLRTGEVRQHDPLLYLTKITSVAPDFAMATPVWNHFLHVTMGGHPEMINYLQRVCGYSLTGSTREHALFFCFGTGANGKSTFINAIMQAAGDYHRTAPIETFTSSNHDRHPTELAGLRGSRVVTAIETEEGRRWAESRIKALTGGDPISARFMRQDFFVFVPQFKLIIAGNHRPGLRSVDEAIRRRFQLIPFSVTIAPEDRDETLADKLKAELPGILAWMIQGCPAWLEHGLAPPAIVTAATSAYLEGEDAISAWLDEMAKREPTAFTKTMDLFGSWSAWAAKAGEHHGTAKRFAQALETRGFDPHKHWQLGRGFKGIRLKDGPSDIHQGEIGVAKV